MSVRTAITGGIISAGAAALYAAPDAIDLYQNRSALSSWRDQNISFPVDIKGNAYIHMRFEKYSRRSIREQPFFSPQNSMKLPLPKELVDNVNVNYSTEDLGPFIGAAADTLARSGDLSTSNGISDAISRITSAVQAGAADIGAGAGASVLSATVGRTAIGSAISSLTGIAINPFQTILFKSPSFKKHRFSWKLVPKNEQESKDIETIVSLFKYHMLPGISNAGGVFFSYPEILQVKLFPKDEYLYRFKPCVVESVSVNYAPNGPSFYRQSQAPTAIDFSISLQEIEIWTKADYLRNSVGGVVDQQQRNQEQAARLAQASRPPSGE